MSFTLYKLATDLCAPFVSKYLDKRIKRGKEEAARVTERYGIATRSRPTGSLIWIHATSMGESRSVLKLIRTLLDRHQDWHILITTGTVTSANMLEKELPERAFHQYMPLDVSSWVMAFLNHWQPNVAIWVEQELWPNMLQALHKRHVPVFLINARVNESSYRRWRPLKPFIKKLLHPFKAIYAQSQYDGQRYEKLSDRAVLTKGNLKYTSQPLTVNTTAFEGIKKKVNHRPVWLAASTHPGEEELVVQAHQIILNKQPDALLVVVPRHVKRGQQIATLMTQLGLRVDQRSLDQDLSDKTQVYLADTMGELGLFYRLIKIAFIGGSLVPIGGHNLIEPAQLGCVTLHGPYMSENKELVEQFAAQQLSYEVKTPEALATQVLGLFKNKQVTSQIGHRAQDFVSQQAQILDAIIQDIETTISGAKESHPATFTINA